MRPPRSSGAHGRSDDPTARGPRAPRGRRGRRPTSTAISAPNRVPTTATCRRPLRRRWSTAHRTSSPHWAARSGSPSVPDPCAVPRVDHGAGTRRSQLAGECHETEVHRVVLVGDAGTSTTPTDSGATVPVGQNCEARTEPRPVDSQKSSGIGSPDGRSIVAGRRFTPLLHSPVPPTDTLTLISTHHGIQWRISDEQWQVARDRPELVRLQRCPPKELSERGDSSLPSTADRRHRWTSPTRCGRSPTWCGSSTRPIRRSGRWRACSPGSARSSTVTVAAFRRRWTTLRQRSGSSTASSRSPTRSCRSLPNWPQRSPSPATRRRPWNC